MEPRGVEGGEVRHRVGAGGDRPGAEIAQLVEERQRVGAVAQDVGVEGEAEMPVRPVGRRLRTRRLGGDRHLRRVRPGAGPDQALQLVEDRRADHRVGAVRVLDQEADVVLGRERHVDQGAAHADLALAHEVERGLEIVGEGRDLGEAEHRPRALDGVERAERGVDQRPVLRPVAEVEERRFQPVEELGGLRQEDLGGIDVGHGGTGSRGRRGGGAHPADEAGPPPRRAVCRRVHDRNLAPTSINFCKSDASLAKSGWNRSARCPM